MLSGALTFPLETAFLAIVLPFICAYLVLVAISAILIRRNDPEHNSKKRSKTEPESA